MGNSSWSVKQALGAFNFIIQEDKQHGRSQYVAEVGIGRQVTLVHAYGTMAPRRFSEPVRVVLYATVKNMKHELWHGQYRSVSDFLSTIYRKIPWDIAKCAKQGCPKKPMPDGSCCEDHTEV